MRLHMAYNTSYNTARGIFFVLAQRSSYIVTYWRYELVDAQAVL